MKRWDSGLSHLSKEALGSWALLSAMWVHLLTHASAQTLPGLLKVHLPLQPP